MGLTSPDTALARVLTLLDLGHRSGLAGEHFDLRLVPARPCLPLVTGDQRHLKGLSEGDETGVIGAEIVPERPNPSRQLAAGKANLGGVDKQHASLLRPG